MRQDLTCRRHGWSHPKAEPLTFELSPRPRHGCRVCSEFYVSTRALNRSLHCNVSNCRMSCVLPLSPMEIHSKSTTEYAFPPSAFTHSSIPRAPFSKSPEKVNPIGDLYFRPPTSNRHCPVDM